PVFIELRCADAAYFKHAVRGLGKVCGHFGKCAVGEYDKGRNSRRVCKFLSLFPKQLKKLPVMGNHIMIKRRGFLPLTLFIGADIQYPEEASPALHYCPGVGREA